MCLSILSACAPGSLTVGGEGEGTQLLQAERGCNEGVSRRPSPTTESKLSAWATECGPVAASRTRDCHLDGGLRKELMLVEVQEAVCGAVHSQLSTVASSVCHANLN
jgi:hypothetical protein